MVSFGLVPSVAMFSLVGSVASCGWIPADYAVEAQYLTFIIVAFSALRLAKFNIDDTQHTEFCGLPTPANGLFCLSLAMLAQSGDITFAKEIIMLTSVVMACLLISPIRMFALKFKGFGWSGNELRYSFLVACVVLIAAFTKYAIPSIILIYIVISTLRWLISSRKA
jgi:CDP-diacylglycerol--serine O-phosphatidyltransferase